MIDDNGRDVQRLALTLATGQKVICRCGEEMWHNGGIIGDTKRELQCDCGEKVVYHKSRLPAPIIVHDAQPRQGEWIFRDDQLKEMLENLRKNGRWIPPII